jgi:hypothetical protein
MLRRKRATPIADYFADQDGQPNSLRYAQIIPLWNRPSRVDGNWCTKVSLIFMLAVLPHAGEMPPSSWQEAPDG